MFYVYVYLDPRKRGKFNYNLEQSFLYEPFYIGKGKNKRLYEHLKQKNNSPKNNKIKKIIKSGYNLKDYILIVKNFLTEQEAFNFEIELINKIGRKNLRTGPLNNLCEGGKGSNTISNHPNKESIISKLKTYKGIKNKKWNKNYEEIYGEKANEQRELRKTASTGILKNEQTKKKISISNKGKIPWNKGLTKETDIRVKSYTENKIYFQCFKSYILEYENNLLIFDGRKKLVDFIKNYNKTENKINKIHSEKLIKQGQYKNFKVTINDRIIRK